jgi:DNA oxidative demethylase
MMRSKGRAPLGSQPRKSKDHHQGHEGSTKDAKGMRMRGGSGTRSLFEETREAAREEMAPGAFLLRGYALASEAELLAGVREVAGAAPFRKMVTPGGYQMSVAMTNCGELGWITDRTGYRYDAIDPESGKAWPAMPEAFRTLAEDAAAAAGFSGFRPDACLINRYEPGAKLSLHQDKDERDFTQPIVSVSLGIPGVFLFGGFRRGEKTARWPVRHGDVVVWGGPARLRYHGVMTIKNAEHASFGRARVNLTFRKAG